MDGKEEVWRCLFADVHGPVRKPTRSWEHFFPEWMHELVDNRVNKHVQMLKAPNQPAEEIRNRAGMTIARKIGCVCHSCNNGWMNELETAARTALSGLITGKHIKLDPDQQKQVGAWITLKTIVGDQDHPPTSAIPAKHCHSFFKDHTPPEGWWISIGSFSGTEWRWSYTHRPMRLQKGGEVLEHDRHYNVQLTFFTAGSLFVACGSAAGFPLTDFGGFKPHLIPIWPFTRDLVDLGEAPAVTDEVANDWTAQLETMVVQKPPSEA